MAKQKPSNIANYHVIYQDVSTQHWHPSSEVYAGGDHLITALENGWLIENCILIRHWYAGMRSVKIYEFNLVRENKKMMMPVIDNPYIGRFVEEQGVNLIVSDDAKIQ